MRALGVLSCTSSPTSGLESAAVCLSFSHSFTTAASTLISSMAAALSSGLRALPTWSSSVCGDEHLYFSCMPLRGRPLRSPVTMGNVNEGKGIFAPLVVVTRDVVGRKRFNQLRGKAIALHSQVITEFCKTIGADPKQRQGLIRLAKKNGEKLGFLA